MGSKTISAHDSILGGNMSLMRSVAAGAALLVAGCASSLPPEFSYTPDSEKALLVFDDSIARSQVTLILAPADLDSGEFVRMPAQLMAGHLNQLDSPGTGRPVYVELLDPGVYVVAGTRSYTGNGTMTRCFARGTIAIELVAGEAAILSQLGAFLARIPNEANAETAWVEHVRQTLAQAPGISPQTPIHLADTVAHVTFQPGIRIVGPGCPGSSRFEIVETAAVEAKPVIDEPATESTPDL
ncbi:MAG: hypothetical protein ACI82N_000009 [Maricaulis sp.]|jgi:hypothetical protein